MLDLGLPRLDGMEVCRRLRAESDVPILMLTARTETEDRVKGLDTGADDYLPKPFERTRAARPDPGAAAAAPATRQRLASWSATCCSTRTPAR